MTTRKKNTPNKSENPKRAQRVMPTLLALSGVTLAVASFAYTEYSNNKLEERVASEVAVMQMILDRSANNAISDSEFKGKVEVALQSIIDDRRQAEAQAQEHRIQSAQSRSGTQEGVPITMNEYGQVVFGNPDADITIHTFEDFRCSFCTRYHPVLEQYVTKSNGLVNWIYKPFPVLGPESVRLANAGECVSQEEGPAAFWNFASLVYKTKDSEFAINNAGLEDPQNILDCTQERRYSSRITESMSEGRELNVTGTPASIFRNNVAGKGFFVSGYLQTHQVDEMVREALNGQ